MLEPPVVARPPEAAVDQDRYGPGTTGASRQRQLPEMIPVIPVPIDPRPDPWSIAAAARLTPLPGA